MNRSKSKSQRLAGLTGVLATAVAAAAAGPTPQRNIEMLGFAPANAAMQASLEQRYAVITARVLDRYRAQLDRLTIMLNQAG